MPAAAATPDAGISSKATGWEKLLGPTLIKDPKGAQTVSTNTAMKNKKLVLLYFSASWCPPCKAFSPVLKSFYELVQSDIEIIYISSDSSVQEFQEYFGKMPWLSFAAEGKADIKNFLAQTFKISSIPTLVVLKRDPDAVPKPQEGDDASSAQQQQLQQEGLEFRFITNDARTRVTSCMNQGNNTQEAAKALVQEWSSEAGVSLQEAGTTKSGPAIPTTLQGWVMLILKNPAAIFAVIYLVKWLLKKYQAMQSLKEGGGDGSEVDVGMEDVPDPSDMGGSNGGFEEEF